MINLINVDFNFFFSFISDNFLFYKGMCEICDL